MADWAFFNPTRSVHSIYENMQTSRMPTRSSTSILLSFVAANAWCAHGGVTVAGGHGKGNETNQLKYPYSLCVDDEDTVIVADWGNHRIVEWKRGATSGTVLAGGKGQGDRPDQLNTPTDVIFDKETDSLIICEQQNRRVTRWPRRKGPRSGETILDKIECYGLAMDNEGSLYVTDIAKHEVRRYGRGETSGIVVAGGNGRGAGFHQLAVPTYVCVDREHAVYVSDRDNDRVMKWVKGAEEGIVVAGGRSRGKDLTQLSRPHGVRIDAARNVYVADRDNGRVMRWGRGASQGTVVVAGIQVSIFSGPIGLSFDPQGHLYVAEQYDSRVQRFTFENNWINNSFVSFSLWKGKRPS